MIDPAHLLLLALIGSIQCSAIPEKSRMLEKELSDQIHGEGDDHNADYDHEAFLGKDEAERFDQLLPEESRKRLGTIYDKIDGDSDGYVTESEMVTWIRYIQRRYVSEDAQRQWKEYDIEEADGDKMSWAAYKRRTYGEEEDMRNDYEAMMKRDERRFTLADEDKDGSLDFQEFINFLHPEESQHMRHVVVMETLEDIDKDGDGTIDEKEYIGDLWSNNVKQSDDDGSEEKEPDWVTEEREHFNKWRDLDGDGKLSEKEVEQWIMPEDYDHAVAEAKHLLHESDSDADEQLTKDEVLEKYDLFVGSQATDFGEALIRHEDL